MLWTVWQFACRMYNRWLPLYAMIVFGTVSVFAAYLVFTQATHGQRVSACFLFYLFVAPLLTWMSWIVVRFQLRRYRAEQSAVER